ncbi:hypothetical protein ABGB07_27485 [Micromonosporaceae bacterium B7E4]
MKARPAGEGASPTSAPASPPAEPAPAKARPTQPAKAQPGTPVKSQTTQPTKTQPTQPVKAQPTQPVKAQPGTPVKPGPAGRAGADRGSAAKQPTAVPAGTVAVPDPSPDPDAPQAGRRLLLPLAAATVVLVGIGVALAVNNGGSSGEPRPAAVPTGPALALGSPLPVIPTSAPVAPPSPLPQATPTPKASSKAPPRPARPASAPKRTPSRKPPAKTTAPPPKPPAPQARISASGRIECTPVDRGWGIAISGSVSNTSATIRSARVSYSSNETGPASNSDTLTLHLSGRSFDRKIPDTSGWEFIGGSSVSWTVTATLSDGKTLSDSGSNTYSCG